MSSASSIRSLGRDWETITRKWTAKIEITPDTADEEIAEYIEVRAYGYRTHGPCDKELWELFQWDFNNFTLDIFNRYYSSTLKLRTALICGGVFIKPTYKGFSIGESLAQTLDEDERRKWDIDGLNAYINQLVKGPITSQLIRISKDEDNHYTAHYGTSNLREKHRIPVSSPPPLVDLSETNLPKLPRSDGNLHLHAEDTYQTPANHLRAQLPAGRPVMSGAIRQPSQPLTGTPRLGTPPDTRQRYTFGSTDIRKPQPPIPRINFGRRTQEPQPEEEEEEDGAVSVPDIQDQLSNQPPPNPPNRQRFDPQQYQNRQRYNQRNPPNQDNDHTIQYPGQSNLAKTISEIGKIYSDGQKYDGSNGAFDHKLTIFLDICKRVELPEEALQKAFPTMLKGAAEDHYYTNMLSKMTWETACNHIRNYYEGTAFHRKNLDKWNSITLSTIIAENPEKDTLQCVMLLIDTLRKLQYGLEVSLRIEPLLHTKVVTACQGHVACRYAVSDPPARFGDLINKLQSSVTTYEKEQSLNSSTYYTDRQYKSSNDHSHSHRPYARLHTDKRKNTCWICGKPDCRSWKHTQKEQDDAKQQYRDRKIQYNKLNPKVRNFESRFNKIYRQHVMDFEGDGSDDELPEIFDSLLMDDDKDEEPQATQFFTVGKLLPNSNLLDQPLAGNFITNELANKALLHQLTAGIPYLTDEPTEALLTGDIPRYGSQHFHGIVIDTGAAKFSTAGYPQFRALQRVDRTVTLDETTKGTARVQFGIGATSSVGSAKVSTPIGQVVFHIMDAKTPFLLCLTDMDKLGVYFNNLENKLVTPKGHAVPVVRRFGHPFLLWNDSLQSFIIESFNYTSCYLTNTELQRLHRRFGHPSVARLQKVLERAGHEVDKTALEYLTKYCAHCQRYSRSPGRFKFHLRDDVNFNYSIIVDVFYIQNQPVLHVIDEATRYQAGRWLKNISAKHTWDALRACWIDTYLGPPDQITTDAGKNFTSKEFNQYATTMGTRIKIVPVEAHNSIGLVERYHGLIRRAFIIIITEIQGLDRDMALQMAFKAINDTAGPDGLVPTLLVYGAYPRMTENDTPAPTVTQRAMAIRKAMAEIDKLRAERQVADALNTRNGPSTSEIHALPLNSEVLVWREGNGGQTGSWKGPFKLLSMDGEDCVIEQPSGQSTFRSTMVKPYLTPTATIEGIDLSIEDESPPTVTTVVPTVPALPAPISTIPVDSVPAQPIKRGRGRPRKYPIDTGNTPNMPHVTVFIQDDLLYGSAFHTKDDPLPEFKDSRQKEVIGLVAKGVFATIDESTIPPHTRIFNARFVEEVKHKGTDRAMAKSRLVVQAYKDGEKHLVLTQSPTIQRVSQRIILCLAPMMEGTDLYLRDISQAYVQSTTELNRNFLIRAPTELAQNMGLPSGAIVKVVKPLYGVPEAGNHWFKTYHNHHIEQVGMEQSTYDPCLLFRNKPYGIIGLQTDDTLISGDQDFADIEENQLKKANFTAKDREKLTATDSLKFNGGLIQLESTGAITLTQARQCQNLQLIIDGKATTTSSRGSIREGLDTKDQFVAQRARGAYISSVCQPEAAFDLSVAAQATDITADDMKALNRRIQWQIENASRGIRFAKLDKNTLQILVFSDASFANNRDLSSQMGYIIVLADSTNTANIIHWSSTKCRRVTRSVLASELYGMAHGFDMGAAIKSTLDKILSASLPLVLCTDSKSLYDCLVRLGTTTEKRLMIDVMCLREAYEKREVAEVRWIKGSTNPADSMTKAKASGALSQLIDTNKINIQVEEWVEREI
jgi:hypothetical protein